MQNQYELIYEKIAEELETGKIEKGLWIRLFSECSGDEQKTKVFYIKQRAEKLISDAGEKDGQHSIVHNKIIIQNQSESIYEKIAQELESGNTEKGLWIRLFSELSGDDQQIKVLYIKQRAEKLIAADREKQEQEVKERAENTAMIEAEMLEQLKGTADGRLVTAVREGRWSITSQLLKEGVQPAGLDERGNSLIEVARKRNDHQMIRLLESYGAIQVTSPQQVEAPLKITDEVSVKNKTSLSLATILSIASFITVFLVTLHMDYGMPKFPIIMGHPEFLRELIFQAVGGSLALPIILVSITSIFKSKRNSSSRRRIFIGGSIFIIVVELLVVAIK